MWFVSESVTVFENISDSPLVCECVSDTAYVCECVSDQAYVCVYDLEFVLTNFPRNQVATFLVVMPLKIICGMRLPIVPLQNLK